MTAATWDVQIARMRAEFGRRGFPWLTADEESTLRAYITRHSGSQ
jgi:hypothetical protein